MRKIAIILGIVLCIGMLGACGAKGSDAPVANPEANTIGTKLFNAFIEESANASDTESIAAALIENELFAEIGMLTMPVEEGFLNGFDDEISGFSSGTLFAPMIGTIPFIGYIFETDNPDALVATLNEHAMLNWNICTVADELVVEKNGNLVYFVMAPNSFDE